MRASHSGVHVLILWVVAAVDEPSRHVFERERRDRQGYGFDQRSASACLSLPDDVLYLREGLPTFIRVVQAHILDDAQGAEDGSRMLAGGDGSRGIAPRPRPLIEIGD
jgi:hypothetical protein